jgi:hypothetical protein
MPRIADSSVRRAKAEGKHLVVREYHPDWNRTILAPLKARHHQTRSTTLAPRHSSNKPASAFLLLSAVCLLRRSRVTALWRFQPQTATAKQPELWVTMKRNPGMGQRNLVRLREEVTNQEVAHEPQDDAASWVPESATQGQ